MQNCNYKTKFANQIFWARESWVDTYKNIMEGQTWVPILISLNGPYRTGPTAFAPNPEQRNKIRGKPKIKKQTIQASTVVRRLRFSSSSSVWSASAVHPTPSQPPQKKSFVGSGKPTLRPPFSSFISIRTLL